MRLLLTAGCTLALAACATRGPVREIQTRDVVVTHVERAVRPDQVPTPPAPLEQRASPISAALDQAVAKICEYVAYADFADPLLQHAAGAAAVSRIVEPVCQGRAQPPR